MKVRFENRDDIQAVYAVNQAAFETSAEAELVNELRAKAHPVISLVAEEAGEIVGHILFSTVSLTGHPEAKIAGLAPMSVIPERQRQGIGSTLVKSGLEACRRLGMEAVVVLGHPEYYPRFGFLPASGFDIQSEYDVPEGVFMMLILEQGALDGKSGTIRYHEAFGML